MMYVQTDGTSGLSEITVTFPDGTVKRFDANYTGNIPFPAPDPATMTTSYNEPPATYSSPPAPNRHERRREAKLSRLHAAARPRGAAR